MVVGWSVICNFRAKSDSPRIHISPLNICLPGGRRRGGGEGCVRARQWRRRGDGVVSDRAPVDGAFLGGFSPGWAKIQPPSPKKKMRLAVENKLLADPPQPSYPLKISS